MYMCMYVRSQGQLYLSADIMSVRTNIQLCVVGHNIVQASAELDLTFANVDLTDVRCWTVIIGLGSNYHYA